MMNKRNKHERIVKRIDDSNYEDVLSFRSMSNVITFNILRLSFSKLKYKYLYKQILVESPKSDKLRPFTLLLTH